MGLWEWDFCLKFLSTPTKTLLLFFETHTLTLDVGQKITNIQSIYHIFNAIILYFIWAVFMLLVFMKAAY